MTSTDQRTDQRADQRAQSRSARRTAALRGRRSTLIAAVVVLLLAIGGWVALRHRGQVAAAPYQDPGAAARLTLCRDGRAVTSGSTVDQPLVTAVVGSQMATGAYATGTTATLYAYQPRQGVGATSWSGLQLAPATEATDPRHPTATLTRADTTLAQFVTAYPAQDGGWVQLRLVLAAPGQAPRTTTYAALDLHVEGRHWTAVGPGHAACPSS